MKNTRSVYLKLREVKQLHLVQAYKKLLKRSPEHCKYNKPYTIETDGKKYEIRLCMLHQPDIDGLKGVHPHLLDVCQESGHCNNCNAYIHKYTKQDIEKLFLSELQDPKISAKKYPDICALEWVLDQDTPKKLNWFQKILFYIKLYSE